MKERHPYMPPVGARFISPGPTCRAGAYKSRLYGWHVASCACSVHFIYVLFIFFLTSCTAAIANGNQEITPSPVLTVPTVAPTILACASATCVKSDVGGIRDFIDTWTNIHLLQSFDYHINDPAPLAKYYDFVWGVTPRNVAAFRSGNPDALLSYYVPFHRDSGTFTDPAVGKNEHDLAYWKSFHPDWILYRCDRVTPAFEYNDPNIPLDFANPALISWQIQTYAQPASEHGYDALAADNLNMENLFGACGFYQNGQWVQRYTGAVDDPHWREDIITWVTRMQAALHALPHPLALIPNLGLGPLVPSTESAVQSVINHVDGVLDESGFTQYGQGYLTDADWLQAIQLMRQVQQQNKPYYSVNQFDTGAIDHTQVQWALASYLMAKEHLASVFISGVQAYGSDNRLPEYTAPIGSPRSALYRAQNVYWRDYSGGLVVVNPSSTDQYTVKTSATTYTDLYGQHVAASFTLPPHSAMILLAG